MDTTLVILAAGMGSRFGGLKQAAPITDSGRGILDFSVYDAKKAGFNKVVFIIREEIEADFKELIGKRIEKVLPVVYVLQDMTILPEGRTKPFGTAQAVLCAKDVVDSPFCIINSDDYYGKNAFKIIHDHLINAKKGEYCMASYPLNKTLSAYGTVNRGVCKIKDGFLYDIKETLKINNDGSYPDGNVIKNLSMDTPVSMNIWGLTLDIFDELDRRFTEFYNTCDKEKDELVIADVIFDAIKDKAATVKVYENSDHWCGITYKEDLPEVRKMLNGYVEDGLYDGI